MIPGDAFSVQASGSNGNEYFFTVKAVGKAGTSSGVYIGSNRIAVVTITPSTSSNQNNVNGSVEPSENTNDQNFEIDTGSKLTVSNGKSYTFKVTSDTTPTFTSGNSSVFKIVPAGSNGSEYYFKVVAVGDSGQSAGVYVNGTLVTVCTIG